MATSKSHEYSAPYCNRCIYPTALQNTISNPLVYPQYSMEETEFMQYFTSTTLIIDQVLHALRMTKYAQRILHTTPKWPSLCGRAKLAMFLYNISNGVSNRTTQEHFKGQAIRSLAVFTKSYSTQVVKLPDPTQPLDPLIAGD